MSYKLLKKETTTSFDKNGVDFIGYEKISDDISIVIEEVKRGHFEEFVHDKSTFTYLFLKERESST